MDCHGEATGDDHSHGHDHSHDHSHEAEADTGPNDSLLGQVLVDQTWCLNEREEGSVRGVFKTWDRRLDTTQLIESDADSELLVHVPFNAMIKLKSILIWGGVEGTAPRSVRVFANRDDLDFDTVGSARATQQWDLVQSTHPAEYSVRVAKFNNVRSLTLHFPESFDGEQSVLYFLAFRVAVASAVVVGLTAVWAAPAPDAVETPDAIETANRIETPDAVETPNAVETPDATETPKTPGATDKAQYTQGSPQSIACQINREREKRYLSAVFLHRTLSDVAASLGQKYADGNLNNSDFDRLYDNKLAPLGNGVSSSYKILGTFQNDQDYVDRLENAITEQLFARTLDAIGVYEERGVYTIVLASGLRERPSTVYSCPLAGDPQFDPSRNPPPSNNKYGVDLPQFLCALNRERAHANADYFAVHTALNSEANEQARQMSRLGHYTVDGPRKVDESLYGQHVNVKKLYWVAGDRYSSAQGLVDLVVSNYGDTALDPAFNVIGVAQMDGFWSVIFGALDRSVRVRNSCPLTLDDVDYTS
ncbi:hypothetical protein GGF46_003668 [Coemansia sp. RSA 552]|nr:hypothetical protein GGF46_003668 [Coemansia sp. RSA 552]